MFDFNDDLNSKRSKRDILIEENRTLGFLGFDILERFRDIVSRKIQSSTIVIV